ncbi:CHAT domain-containing protein [Thalassobellus citreus]|uniref:CHAT domain-containing protein n=1 Tax=Thalassobellus citreus TaxID=3367752 RepID=UPI0037AD8567
MKKLAFLVFLISSFGFSQNLEETIYVAAETFIANQNETTLKILNTQETHFKNQVKTKDEQLALVFLQCHKGSYLNKHSKLKDAIKTFEDALNRFNNNNLSKFSDFDITESCLKPLGNLYIKTADFTNAKSTINQYIFLAKKEKNIKHQISGAINLAKLFQVLGDHKSVIKIIENALNLPHIPASKKANLISIKTTSQLALNDFEITSHHNPLSHSSSFDIEKNNSLIEIKKGNFKNALVHFNKAKSLLNEAKLDSRSLAKFHFQEAQLYYLLEVKNKALKSLKTALKILSPNYKADGLPNKSQLYAENTFIDIFDLYAVLQSNPDDALNSYDLSFHVSNLLGNNWTSQETKILNETENRIRSEKCINILFDYYNQTKNKDLLFKALQYSENNKVSTLKEIFQKKLRLQYFPNDSLLNKEFNLLKEQERITTLLIKELLESNNASNINTLNKTLGDLNFQLKTIKEAINQKHPKEETSFSLKTIQSKLSQDNTALTEYFFGKNNLYQFIVSKDDIILNKIPLDEKSKSEILHFIHLFDNPSIINNDISNYTKQAFNLYKLLNFNKLSSYKNKIIIPDGSLNFMPFEALLTSPTNTPSFSKMPFVVKKHNIIYNTSILFYLNEIEKSKNDKVLGFFPVFENTNQSLSYSIDEAKAIEKQMTSKLFMNANATKSNFIENASQYGIIHLSTHASAGNSITPASMQFYDENLLLNDLYSMNLSANLVVMSACETGVGIQRKGEGAMSMARGFQYAGAKNLLFSLWQINDLSTSQIMKSFYKEYNNNKSGYISNHLSKITYLENDTITNAKKSPYYWSAFVFYGSVTEPVSNNTLFYILIGVVIILIIVFLALKLNKHARNTSRLSS